MLAVVVVAAGDGVDDVVEVCLVNRAGDFSRRCPQLLVIESATLKCTKTRTLCWYLQTAEDLLPPFLQLLISAVPLASYHEL